MEFVQPRKFIERLGEIKTGRRYLHAGGEEGIYIQDFLFIIYPFTDSAKVSFLYVNIYLVLGKI